MTDWFHSERYGFGAGLPCSWQGWVVLAIFLAFVMGGGLLFGQDDPLVFAIILLSITPIFLLVVWRTTEGRWEWRVGGKDDK